MTTTTLKGIYQVTIWLWVIAKMAVNIWMVVHIPRGRTLVVALGFSQGYSDPWPTAMWDSSADCWYAANLNQPLTSKLEPTINHRFFDPMYQPKIIPWLISKQHQPTTRIPCNKQNFQCFRINQPWTHKPTHEPMGKPGSHRPSSLPRCSKLRRICRHSLGSAWRWCWWWWWWWWLSVEVGWLFLVVEKPCSNFSIYCRAYSWPWPAPKHLCVQDCEPPLCNHSILVSPFWLHKAVATQGCLSY